MVPSTGIEPVTQGFSDPYLRNAAITTVSEIFNPLLYRLSYEGIW